jgi:hypothetical protein
VTTLKVITCEFSDAVYRLLSLAMGSNFRLPSSNTINCQNRLNRTTTCGRDEVIRKKLQKRIFQCAERF